MPLYMIESMLQLMELYAPCSMFPTVVQLCEGQLHSIVLFYQIADLREMKKMKFYLNKDNRS